MPENTFEELTVDIVGFKITVISLKLGTSEQNYTMKADITPTVRLMKQTYKTPSVKNTRTI